MGGATTARVFGIVTVLITGCSLGACSSGSYGFDGNNNRVSTLGNLLSFKQRDATALDPSRRPAGKAAMPRHRGPGRDLLQPRLCGRWPGQRQRALQFSMGDAVRECSRSGEQLVLKVGVEGRALLGPAGTAGAFTAPVRIAVRNERTGKPVVSKLFQVPVTIAAGDNGAPFQPRVGRVRRALPVGPFRRRLLHPRRVRPQGRRPHRRQAAPEGARPQLTRRWRCGHHGDRLSRGRHCEGTEARVKLFAGMCL